MQLIVHLPFKFKVSEISFWTYAIPVDEMMITAIRYFLLKLGVRAVSRLFFDSWQVDWKEMVPFAKVLLLFKVIISIYLRSTMLMTFR